MFANCRRQLPLLQPRYAEVSREESSGGSSPPPPSAWGAPPHFRDGKRWALGQVGGQAVTPLRVSSQPALPGGCQAGFRWAPLPAKKCGQTLLGPMSAGTALCGSPIALHGGARCPPSPTEGGLGASVSPSEGPHPGPVGVQ